MLYGSECWALSRVDASNWMHWISGAWGGSLKYAGTIAFLTVKCGTWPNNLPLLPSYRKKTHAVWSSGQNGRVDRRQENSDCSSPEWVEKASGRPYTSWMATLKNDLAQHNLTLEDAIELSLNKPLWRLLAASGATHWWCMPNNDDDDDIFEQNYLA